MRFRIIALLVALALVSPTLGRSHAMAEPLRADARVAFFGLTFIDTSTEGAVFGARDDEAARIAMLETYVRDAFAEKGFALLGLDPVRADLDRVVNPADCNGCDVRMAAKLGADYAVTGEVQKVSNLILSMNLVVREAENGAFVRGLSVDIRGNTDDSWRRGMRYILRNNIFKED